MNGREGMETEFPKKRKGMETEDAYAVQSNNIFQWQLALFISFV